MEKIYEIKFHWDDQEEAACRGTKRHRQDGLLKVMRLSHETDEQFNTRAKYYYDRQIRNLFGNLARRGCGVGIVSNNFPQEFRNEQHNR